MTYLTITVPGKPIGKGRPRSTKRGITYTPQKTRDWEKLCSGCALEAMKGTPGWVELLDDEPVQITVVAAFRPPKSWARAKRAAMEGAFHIGKPDTDNILKIAMDGLVGTVIKDDAIVAFANCMKVWGPTECVTITVTRLNRAGVK